jgi:ankyrin repeat protein
MELLFRHRANVNARNDSGSTPLHVAAMQGHVAASAQLLSRGANVDARSQHNTPLSLAVRFNHNEVVALLLKHGADVHVVSDRGMTLFDDLIETSKSWTSDRRDLAELLFNAGIDIHDDAGKRGTPLHRAVGRGHVELVNILIQRGARVNARDQRQRTPLHIAVERQQPEIVEMLVEKGAEINPRDSQGYTPMYYAWGSGVAGRIREILRRHGGVGAFGEPRR